MSQPLIIPGFSVLRELTSDDGSVGGMARVFKARRETETGRSMRALKVLRDEKVDQAEVYQAFYRERDILSRISSRHVVRIYPDESSQQGQPLHGWHVLSLEWIEGCDLRHLVAEEGILPVERAVSLACDLLTAIEAVHDAGLVHCDVRPANIRLEAGTNRLVLLDLGIAVGHESDGNTRSVMGAMSYMSPEHFEPHKLVPASDLYCAGLVLYFMLTRRTPFSVPAGPDAFVRAAMMHRSQPPPSPRRFNPQISADLEDVILRALAKSPADRHLSAAAFREALLGADLSVESPADDPVAACAPMEEATQTTKRMAHESQRGILLVLGIVAAIVPIIGLLLTLLFWESADPPEGSESTLPTLAVKQPEPAPAVSAAITSIDSKQFDAQREDFVRRFSIITNELHRMQVSDFPRWRSAARTNVWSIVLSNRNEVAERLDAWTTEYAVPMTELVQYHQVLVERLPPDAATEGLFDPEALAPWVERDLLAGTSNQLVNLHGQLQQSLLDIGLHYTNVAQRLERTRTNALHIVGQTVHEIEAVRQQLGQLLTHHERTGFAHASLILATDDDVAKELLARLLAIRQRLDDDPLNRGPQLQVELRDRAPVRAVAYDPELADMHESLALLNRAADFRVAYRELARDWQAVKTDLGAEIERRRAATPRRPDVQNRERFLEQLNGFQSLVTAMDIHASRLTSADSAELLRLWNREGAALAAALNSPLAGRSLSVQERNHWRYQITSIQNQALLYQALDAILTFIESGGQTTSPHTVREQIQQIGLSDYPDEALLLPLAGLLDEVAAASVVDEQGHRSPRVVAYTVGTDDSIARMTRELFGDAYLFPRRRSLDPDNHWVAAFIALNNRPRSGWERLTPGETLQVPVWRSASESMNGIQFNTTTSAIDSFGRSDATEDQLLAKVMLHSLFWVHVEGRVLFDQTRFYRELDRFLRTREMIWPFIDRGR